MSSTISTTIRNTVGTVPFGYESKVNEVIAAVEGLAEQAAESLRESGRNLGATDEQIDAALVSAGLVEAEPVPEVAQPADEDRLGKIEAAVARLTALAERHLGRL